MLNDFYQTLNPIAFSIGPIDVRWYGLAYVAGFLCAVGVMYVLARRWKIRMTSDALLTILLCAMLGILLGARLGYCIFYGNGYYFSHPAEILAFSQGGMSFHGGLIGGMLGGIVAARITHIPYLTLMDLGFTGAPLGLFFGRCANFINGELWGAVTDVPWGVVFGGSAGTLARHPSQLYEALLEGVVIFIVLIILARHNPPHPRGINFSVFLILYGVFRFAIEFVRQPDAQLGYLWGGWLTMGQVLSAPLIVAGVILLVWSIRHHLPQQGVPESLCSTAQAR